MAMVEPVPAGMCTGISLFGVVILSFLGWGFDHNVQALMGSVESPHDGHAVAKLCYSAAIVYAIFVGFCGCQLSIHSRRPRGEIRL
ncbi:hypothetical protein DL93DRAFT_2082758 [Clavulina sp. PMI_390]|nr:hypothetical protein DL93DRAFT_2082758 [Clavulina sp. PMI_390]